MSVRNAAVSSFFAILGLRLLGGGAAFASEPLTLASPDGSLTATVEVKAKPQPYLSGERIYYRVSYKGTEVLRDSPLGLDFLNAPALDHGFEIVNTSRTSEDRTWQNPFGTRRVVPDHYNQLTVSLKEREAPRRKLDIIFRAYSEGLAFRYFLPKQEGLDNFILSSENTGIYFARPVFAYAPTASRFLNAYETTYRRMNLSAIKPASAAALPLLVEMPNGPWVAILEADLDDYAGAYLSGVPGVPDALMTRLAPLPDQFYEQHFHLIYFSTDEAVIGSAPKVTPWRVILIHPRPGGLIESDYLILNLNPPTAFSDTAWIQPGKAVWSWWSGNYATNVSFKPGMNTETMEHYTDFAADHHVEYILIDAGWSARDDITRPRPDFNLLEVLDHARQKGVKVILWVHWEAVKKQMDVAFPLYEKWGAAGVKIDFMNRDDQEMVNFTREMVRKAAEHHLVVDLHGAYEPTGLRRTYPNLLTREAVMGMEYSRGSDLVSPEHDVTLPFTRMLAGPMDYTPGCFNNATRGEFKPRQKPPQCQGTRAHQLAMYVVFLSPLQMLSDYPESYGHNPGVEFLERVPTVWDETKVLNGEPAKYITIARRKGDVWYLGAMTNWDARDLEIPFDFLGSGKYEAEVFADGPNAEEDATSLSVNRKPVSADGRLTLRLAPGGGAAVIFRPVN